MYFKFRTITGIEISTIRQIIDELQSIRKGYSDAVDPIKSDIEGYHIVAFHKFTYQFHNTLSKVLRVDSMHTTTELVRLVESLNSKNYQLGKQVKLKEDELLKANDKKEFFTLKEDLEKLIYDKNFFSTLEHNVVKNNLVVELRVFIDKIDELEFSGKKIRKEDVYDMFSRSDNFISMLTDISDIKNKTTHGLQGFIVDEVKRLLGRGAEFDDGREIPDIETIEDMASKKKKQLSADHIREADRIIDKYKNDNVYMDSKKTPEKAAQADKADKADKASVENPEESREKSQESKDGKEGKDGTDGKQPKKDLDDDTLNKIDKIIDKYRDYLSKEGSIMGS